MPLTGQAIIVIWNDIVPESREGFFEWHPREHMNERLGIPGFLRGRRYRALEEGIEFFTLYEAEDKQILTGNSYKRRLNSPTPWSLEVLPGFRNNLRGVCDIVQNAGYADGGLVHTLRFSPAPGFEQSLRERLAEWCKSIVATPRVTGAQLVICDKSLSGTNTALQRGRTITAPDWVLLVEASASEGIEAAKQAFANAGIQEEMEAGAVGTTYTLEYQVSRLTVAAEPD